MRTLSAMGKRRDFADIRKKDWRLLAPDELGAVLAILSHRELHAQRLAVRGQLRRRRLEAVRLFGEMYGPLAEKWFWVRRELRTPRFETAKVKFRWKPMWHFKRL
jgi:hypothetical protein